MRDQRRLLQAFTLIELSIVLVVIGLVVGSLLVGRDLISAAAVRSQISQVEKYQQAVNTFQGKYGYLPGDIPEPDATKFGFVARGQAGGQGDGNGLVAGNACGGSGCTCGFCVASGETSTFWVDLSTANLIGAFTQGEPTFVPSAISGTAIDQFVPPARIGRSNYLYSFSGGYGGGNAGAGSSDGANYLGLSAVSTLNTWYVNSTPALTVREAHSIDSKVDDGLPQNGRIQANYYNHALVNYAPAWAGGAGYLGTGSGTYGAYPSTAPTTATSTTCFDNNNLAGAAQQYSMTQYNGSGVNCALSFKLQ